MNNTNEKEQFYVYVIEDCEAKYRSIKNALEELKQNVVVIRKSTFVDGEASFQEEVDAIKRDFDLIIIDNFLPNQYLSELPNAHARLLAREFKRKKVKTPICQISSELDRMAMCEYFINYDLSCSLVDSLKEVLEQL